MLLNLLANAVQYSDATRAITVRAWRQGSEVGVMVQDRGVGVEPSERERIFEDFYRGDTPVSSRHGGLGLGLALVRRIATAHGARIDVASRRGEGSAFTIWFPIVDAAVAPAPERPQLSSTRNEGTYG
jgi:two-component system sensor histidine kinase SenX3